jgi:Protein of unknown function (DUF2795)
VERGSDKHGARQDEQLAHEVEGLIRGGHSTHAQEWKDPEPSGEDQPDADLAPQGTLEGAVPEGMSATDVEERSELATFLGKDVYPAERQALLERATANAAPERVLRRLEQLPEDRRYENVQDIWSTLGGGVEQHRF